MRSLTVDQIIALDPCYSDDEIRELAGDKTDWTAVDILRLDIPVEDRFWLVLREELIPAETLRAFARWCALSVAHLWNMPPIVRSYLETGDDSIRAAAWNAARGAAWNAAWAAREVAWAAWYATLAAARASWDATWDATWDAARAAGDATRDAARAAGDATRDAARAAQVEKLLEMLEESC